MRSITKFALIPPLLALGGALGGALQANLLLMPTTPAASGACAGIGWQLCASNKATGSAVTTGAAVIDSTGADLIVIGASHDSADDSVSFQGTITDNKGNGSYTRLNAGGGFGLNLFWIKPTPGTGVGPGHSFSYTGVTAAAIVTMAFKGSAASAPFEVYNSSASSDGNTTTTGPLTPPADNYLVVISAKSASACTFTLPGGTPYTIAQQAQGVAAVSFGQMAAYWPQPTIGNGDTTVTCTGGTPAAMIASFRPSLTQILNVDVSK